METKEIALNTLALRHFKGTVELTLDIQGRDMFAYGKNGTGKTTIADAWYWLLFGKDSNDRQKFDLQPLDENNNQVHGLDTEVEGSLSLTGEQLTLKKIYREKWTKKRGSAKKLLTGHVIDHFINGVPVKQREYEAKINSIMPEETFRLLTDPRYFSATLTWQQRRKVLLEVCGGDVSDADVIASNSKLSGLPDILGGRDVEEHKKMIKAKQQEVNDELERVPVRIDEATRGLPNVARLDKEGIERKLAELLETKQEKEQQKLRLESGGEIAEKQKALREIEANMQDIENRFQRKLREQLSAERAIVDKLDEEMHRLDTTTINPKTRAIDSNNSEIKEMEARMESLRSRFYEADARTFEHEQENTCPTCGQGIPAEQLEAAREKALATFNHEKAQGLENINEKGEQLRNRVDEMNSHSDRLREEVDQANERLAEIEQEKAKVQATIDELKTDSVKNEPDYQELAEGKRVLEDAIAALKDGNSDALDAVKGELTEISKKISALDEQLNDFKRLMRFRERITELEAQERKLSAEYERLEKELNLIDQFNRTKVDLLEGKINSRFKHATFKLFHEYIGGGIEPCCETLYQGVPYNTGMSNGERINIGLDIINTLSEHYGVMAPIFIDQCEAVTQLIETRGQTISLVVSKPDAQLRIEYGQKVAA